MLESRSSKNCKITPNTKYVEERSFSVVFGIGGVRRCPLVSLNAWRKIPCQK